MTGSQCKAQKVIKWALKTKIIKLKAIDNTNTIKPLFRVHPQDQSKCPLNRGSAWLEVELGFIIINQQRQHKRIIIRDFKMPQRRRQRERQKGNGLKWIGKATTLRVHHAFLYILLAITAQGFQ